MTPPEQRHAQKEMKIDFYVFFAFNQTCTRVILPLPSTKTARTRYKMPTTTVLPSFIHFRPIKSAALYIHLSNSKIPTHFERMNFLENDETKLPLQ